MSNQPPADPQAGPNPKIRRAGCGALAERARGSRSVRERRKARILALETLYETDVARHHPGEILRRRSAEVEPTPARVGYARDLLAGVLQHRRELDEIIQARASEFPVE